MKPWDMMRRSGDAGGSSPTVFAAWGTLNKSLQIALSSGDLIATLASKIAYYNSVRANIALSGKQYWEISFIPVTVLPADSWGVGVGTATLPPATGTAATSQYLGGTAASAGLWDDGSVVKSNGVIASTTLPGGALVIGFAFDATTLRLWIGDGVGGYIGGGDPASNTSPTTTMNAGGPCYPVACAVNNTQAFELNAGQSSFGWSVPSGFSPGIF